MSESGTTLQLIYHVGLEGLGRRRLAESTGLSEMTVRLELERLRERGYVDLKRAGPELTNQGRHHFAPVFERIGAVQALELTTLRLDAVALAAYSFLKESPPAWAIRDVAIREGATGLVLLQYSESGWSFTHDDEPVRLRNAHDALTIETAFPDPACEDGLIIASAPDRRLAGLGLWGAIGGVLFDLPRR
ncbi:MAG: hypothetical protein WBC63_03010 [Candidatus Bipolaricaulia bacterium]